MPFRHMAWTGDQSPTTRALPNRRAVVRYQCGLAMPGRIEIEGEEWQRAWVLDLCLSGVGLLLSRPLQAGTNVVVQLLSSPSNQPHRLAAVVRHATRQPDGEWVIGFEFATKLSDDELDMLLQ